MCVCVFRISISFFYDSRWERLSPTRGSLNRPGVAELSGLSPIRVAHFESNSLTGRDLLARSLAYQQIRVLLVNCRLFGAACPNCSR